MSSESANLAGKHAVVTGGSRGIGLAIARALAAAGARVSVVSRTPRENEFFSAQADVSDEVQVERAFAVVRAACGPIDILVNNSGISESAPLSRTTKEMWDSLIATNLTGTFLCTRAAIADMKAATWGRMLNVASTAGLGGAPYISAYCASKHGMIGFTRAIAAEFVGTNITANAIAPGYTDTEMMQQALTSIKTFTGASDDAARSALAKMNPGGRIATLDEVAAAALALIAGTRTGVAVVIPGGAEA